MQLVSLFGLALAAPLASAIAIAPIAPRDDNVPISYATAYLDESLSISDYGCGTAPDGNLLKSYSKFVDVLADYYSIIATPWAADDKSACGQCVEVTYTNANGTTRTVYGVTVDSTGGYFNFDKAGFAGLDGYGSFAAGTLRGSATTVDISKCLRTGQ